jgi:hypothetical protein
MLAANVAWFGGLLRLIGEAGFRVVSEVAPTESDQRNAVYVVVGIAVVGVVAFLLWRWPWYRAVLRQTQEDARSLWGLPPKAAPPLQGRLARTGTSVALVLVPALAVAALLPGPIAAAVATIIGLVVRVAVVVVTFGTTTT